MYRFIFTTIILLFGTNTFGQESTEIKWSDIEITGSKTIKIKMLGTYEKVDWPLFSEEIQKLDGETIVIEGYFLSIDALNMETFKTETTYLITIANKPTIKVCGVPQFRQNEFIRLKGDFNVESGEKIKISGILRINDDGSNESLLSIENPVLM